MIAISEIEGGDSFGSDTYGSPTGNDNNNV